MSETLSYLRVSSQDQNLDRQYQAIAEAGITADREFPEKISGATRERPQLDALLRYVRKGDTVVVASMDRLARSLHDLEAIVTELDRKGVSVRFLKEGLTFIPGHDDKYSVFQLQVLGAVAQLERSIIRDRQADGIAVAKAKGVYKGRKPSLTAEQAEEIRGLIAEGVNKSEIARRYGVDRSSLYRALAR